MPSPLENVTKAVEPIVDQPLARRLLSEASGLRDRTIRMQEATLAAFNLPTAADLARLERRLRGVSDSLTRLDEHLDRVERQIRRTDRAADTETLRDLRGEIAALREELGKTQ